MFGSAERLMCSSGLDVKPSKCAVPYARRSGNNWYKGKCEVKPNIYVHAMLNIYAVIEMRPMNT